MSIVDVTECSWIKLLKCSEDSSIVSDKLQYSKLIKGNRSWTEKWFNGEEHLVQLFIVIKLYILLEDGAETIKMITKENKQKQLEYHI